MSDPDVSPLTEQERQLRWLEQNLTLDRRGRVALRGMHRIPVFTGLGLGILIAAAWAVSGTPHVVGISLSVAMVVTGVCTVVGAVVWIVGWATGPKGALADHNLARRFGARILEVALAGFMMFFALFGSYVLLASLGLHHS